MSSRSYEGGGEKRKKKKQEAEDEISKLPKLDKESDEPKIYAAVSQSRDIHPTPDTEPDDSDENIFVHDTIAIPTAVGLLKNILTQYPNNGQIIKELVQNAEDAGASVIEILHDKRQFTAPQANKKIQSFVKGPGLCLYNDGVFSERDWNGICMLSESIKKDDPLKVGQFGLGFKSVFHLTDVVTILSGKKILFMDPREPEEKMCRFLHLKNLANSLSIQDCLSLWGSYISEDHLTEGCFPGTIFWLSLRQEPSVISPTVYSIGNVEELFESFEKEAHLCLRFLKSLEKISIKSKCLKDGKSKLLHQVKISSPNLPGVRIKRKDFQEKLQECNGFPVQPIMCSYEVTLSNYSLKKGNDQQTFHILHYLQGSDMLNPVVWKGNDSGRHIPLVGVAAPKTSQGKGGHIFCFLPLPQGSTDSTGLPVDINGYFVLGQNRRHVEWKTQESSSEPSVLWNEDLVERLIAESYFLLLENMLPEVEKGFLTVETWYSLLPNVESTFGRWKQLSESLWRRLQSTPIIYSKITLKMHLPHEVLCANSLETSSDDVRRAVMDLLSSKNVPLVTLPSNILSSLTAIGSPPSFVTPQVVREELKKKAPIISESSQMHLLEFCLKDKNYQDLLGLCLLPLENEMWTVFSIHQASVYLCTEDEAAALLGVEANLVRTSLPSETQNAFNTIATSGVAQLKIFSLQDHGVELLKKSVTFVKENHLPKEKLGFWLDKVWSLIQPLELRSAENLAIIPTSSSLDLAGFIPLTNTIIELKCSTSLSKETIKALELLKIKAVAPLPSYIRHHQLHNYINPSDSHGVTAAINNVLQNVHIHDVADYFNTCRTDSESRCICNNIEVHNITPKVKDLFKALNIFKATGSNNSTVDVSINSFNKIFPKLHDDFPVSSPETLIVPRDQTERQLAIELGARELSKEEICLLALKNTYCERDTKKLCIYVMKDHSVISAERICNQLKNLKFVPSVSGEFFMPCQLYDPEDANVAALTGEDLFPAADFKRYLVILRALGLKKVADMPKNQVIEIVRNLSNESFNENEKHMKSTALLKLIDCHEDCAEICQNLMNVPCVYGRSNRPRPYPETLLWVTTPELLEPQNAKNYERYFHIIGSVVPLVECSAFPNAAEAFKWNQGPTMEQVIHHLENIVVSYQGSDRSYFDLIKRTYSYINSIQDHGLDNLSRLTSVFTEHGFKYPNQVYIRIDADDTQLFPYMHPLPYELREYDTLFAALGCYEKQSKELYVDLLKQIKDRHDSGDGVDPDKDRQLVIQVLQRLQKYIMELAPSDLLFPVETCDGRLEMMEKGRCSYSEQSCDWLDEEELEVKIVHSSVGIDLVKVLGVAPLNQHLLAGEQSVLEWGQEEPLTTRLHNLLKYYRDGLPVLKEMVQNADDAKATSVSFMYDQRQNEDAKTRLISEGMKDFQGPALWVHNDAKFTEKDFVNLRKLGGGTKELDVTKIGKFGLGFCSVYNLTDLPSFVSDSSYVIFDPHMAHLDTRLKSPGIRYDFRSTASNKVMLKKLHGQFKPFEDVFGCNLQSTMRFEGTLFRFPLRTPLQAVRSHITNISYGEKEVFELLKMFYTVIGEILLFTQNITEIKIYHLPEDASSPHDKVLLFTSSKRLQRSLSPINGNQISNFDLQKSQVEKASELCIAGVSSVQNVYEESNIIDIFVQCTNRGSDLCNTAIVAKTVSWIVSWHSGYGMSSCNALKEKALSLGAVAVPVIRERNVLSPVDLAFLPDGFYKESHIHCFLPLPIKTPLPVHINGFFQVSSDRTSLITVSEDDRSDDLNWNSVLFKDAVCAAYHGLLTAFRLEGLSEKCQYHCLWPLKSDKNDHFTSILTESFYGFVVQYNPKVFRWQTEWHSLTECRFLEESIYEIPSVGEAAFELLKSILTCHKLTLMILPRAAVDSFQDKEICQNMIDLWPFYAYYFIPNIEAPMMEAKKRDIVTLFALDNHMTQPLSGILDNLSTVPCVPVEPYAKLQQPKNTVDPGSQIASLFLIDEERFPEEFFVKKHLRREALTKMGMVNEKSMTLNMIIDRAESVQTLRCPKCAESRASEILLYIGRQQNVALRNEIVQKVKVVPFLPVMSKPEDWVVTWKSELDSSVHAQVCKDHVHIKCQRELHLLLAEPINVCSSKVLELAGSISLIFRPSNINISENILKDMGIITEASDLPIQTVINQLKIYSSEYQECSCPKLKKACHAIYQYLEQSLQYQNQDLDFLKSENIFLTGECGFKSPQLFAFSDMTNCPPDIFSVKAEGLDMYPRLLCALGVPKFVPLSTVLEAISNMKSKYQFTKLSTEDVMHLSKLLSLLFIDCTEYKDNQYLAGLYLPDVNGTLLPVGSLCIDDGVGLSSGAFNFVHPKISLSEEMRKEIGIPTKTRKRLSDSSNRLHFGQNEPLTTRIRNILSEYPCDSGIMKELLQNADDAGATEVAFIKDFRNLPTERLFDKAWSPLQGPALCIYNNKGFSKEDLQSIQNLGDSSKKEDPSSTGQYGIGFNAVYHLTDAPSFITKGYGVPQGETLCLFDPHCRYDPMATPDKPGAQFVNLNNLRQDHPHSFVGYLEKDFLQEEGTMFRLPLRRDNKSEISENVMSPSELSQKLKDFSLGMKSCLLFLRNVRKISVMNINNEGECETEYWVEAAITGEEKLDKLREITHSKTLRNPESRKSLYSINLIRACYEMQVTDSNEETYRWYIVQQLGAENPESVPDSVRAAFIFKELSLLPHGGCAVLLETNVGTNKKPQEMEEDEKSLCVTSCYLPLPVKSGLPFCINGHFTLNASRRDLWTGIQDAKSQWNNWLMKEVLAPAATHAVEYYRQYIFLVTESVIMESEYECKIRQYYKMFPDMEMAQSENWKHFIKFFYEFVTEHHFAFFDVYSPTSEIGRRPNLTSDMRSQPDPRMGKLSWHCFTEPDTEYSVVFESEPDNEHRIMPSTSEHISSHADTLQKIFRRILDTLKRLGMKIGANFMHKKLKDANISHKLLDANVALEFLLSWNTQDRGRCMPHIGSHIKESPYLDLGNVSLLLEYISKSDEFVSKLNKLPLLITADDIVKCFDETKPVFLTEYWSLASPELLSEFVNKGLLAVLFKILSVFKIGLDVVHLKPLKLNDLAERLPQILDDHSFQEDGTEIAIKEAEYKKSATGKFEMWLTTFWRFVAEDLANNRYAREHLNNVLGNWVLFPVKNNEDSYVINVRRASYVLDSRSKLDFPFNALPIPYLHEEILHSKNVGKFVATLRDPVSVLEALYFHKEKINKHFTEMQKRRTAPVLGRFVALEPKAGASKILDYFGSSYLLFSLFAHKLRSLALFEDAAGKLCSLERKKIIVPKGSDSDFQDLVHIGKMKNIIILQRPTTEAIRHLYLHIERDCIMEDLQIYSQLVLPNFSLLSKEQQFAHLKFLKGKLADTQYVNSKNWKPCQRTVIEVLRITPWICVNGEWKTARDFYDPYNLVFQAMDLVNLPDEWKKVEWQYFLKLAGMKHEITPLMFIQYAGSISVSSGDVQKKSRALLDHLRDNYESLKTHVSQFRDIEFIVPEQCEKLRKIMPHFQTQSGLISFSSSVSWEYEKIIWTTYSFLPENVIRSFRNRKFQDLINRELPPEANVLRHVASVCSQLKSNHPEETDVIDEVMESIYKYLSDGKIENLHQKLAAENIPIIHLPEKKTCVKPDIVVQSLEEEIVPYLYKAPLIYGRYVKLFAGVGVKENANADSYANVLKMIYDNSKGEILHPEESRKMKMALESLLKKKTTLNDLSVSDLYLPTQDGKLVKFSEMYVADRPYYERLIKAPLDKPMFIGFSHLKIEGMRDSDFVNLLPDRYRPIFLSDVVEEEFEDGIETSSPLLEQLRNFFKSNVFVFAILRLILYERRGSGRRTAEETRKQLERQLESLEIKQLPKLAVTLKLNGKIIGSRTRQYFIRTKIENNIPRTCVYISETIKQSFVSYAFVEAFTELLNIKSPLFIRMLGNVVSNYEKPQDIRNTLKELGVDESRDNDATHLFYTDIGSYLPHTLIHMLDNEFCQFCENEMVCMKKYLLNESDDDDDENLFIIIQIIRQVFKGSSKMLDEYEVKVGNNETCIERVKAHQLYKFVRREASYDCSINANNGVPPDTDEDKEVSEEEIRKRIREQAQKIWEVEDEKERRHLLRRLMLKWHPEMNPQKVELCTRTMQYMQNLIAKLEKGENISEDENDTGNSNYALSELYENVFRSPPTIFTRRHYKNRKTKIPDRPEARKWMQQAQHDLDQARYQELSPCWTTFMCYQAAEKALMAALYAEDCVEAACRRNQRLFSPLTSLAFSLIGGRRVSCLCKELSSRVGYPINILYPNYSGIPVNRYSAQDATFMLDRATQLLDIIKHWI